WRPGATPRAPRPSADRRSECRPPSSRASSPPRPGMCRSETAMADDSHGEQTKAAAREHWQLGGTHRKVDAMERMRGINRYTDDLKLPGMLHGKIKRSPHAHARILSIDTHRAEAMPGVHAVVTGRDFPIPYGIIPWT